MLADRVCMYVCMYVCLYIQFWTSIFPHILKLFPVVEKSVQVRHVYVVRGLVLNLHAYHII